MRDLVSALKWQLSQICKWARVGASCANALTSILIMLKWHSKYQVSISGPFSDLLAENLLNSAIIMVLNFKKKSQKNTPLLSQQNTSFLKTNVKMLEDISVFVSICHREKFKWEFSELITLSISFVSPYFTSGSDSTCLEIIFPKE